MTNSIGVHEMHNQPVQPIGTALVVNGTVRIERATGGADDLKPSDSLYLNDRIITGYNGSAAILLADSGTSKVHLDEMTDIVLDENVLPDTLLAESGDVLAEVRQIQQLLLEDDVDPTLDLEAPAAGPGAGVADAGGGISTVRFELTADEVTPDSGAETTGIGFNFVETKLRATEVEQNLALAGEEPAAVPDSIASFSTTVDSGPTEADEPDIPVFIPPGDPLPPDEPETELPPGSPSAGEIERFVDERGLDEGSGNPVDNPTQTSGTLDQLGIDGGLNGLASVTFSNTLTGNSGVYTPGSAGSVVVQGEYGDLTIYPDGTWDYLLAGNTTDHDGQNQTGTDDTVTDGFTFVVEDNGGQTVTGGLTVDVYDDGPVLSLASDGLSGTVHEDALSNGIPDTGEVNQVATTFDLSGLLTSSEHGADGEGTLSFAIVDPGVPDSNSTGLTSGGSEITYSIDPTTGDLVGLAGGAVIFRFSLSETDGAWSGTFTLEGVVDHSGAEDDNELVSLDTIGSWVEVKITDGDADEVSDTLDGLLSVDVENDLPTLGLIEGDGLSGTVHEDALPNGIPDAGEVNQVATTFDLSGLLTSSEYGADEAGILSFSIVDPGGPASTGLKSGGVDIIYSVDTATGDLVGLAGSEEIFRFSLSETDGAWSGTFTLEGVVDHSGAEDDNELVSLDTIGSWVEVKITDGDADEVSDTLDGLLSVDVENDLPTLGLIEGDGLSGTVHEDALPNGIPDAGEVNQVATTFDLSGLLTSSEYGADEAGILSFSIVDPGGPASTGLKSGGVDIIYSVDTATGDLVGLAGSEEIFRFSLSETNGSWNGTFTLEGVVDHSGTENDNDLVSLNSIGNWVEVRISDGDADEFASSLGGLLSVNIENDLPEIGSTQDSLLANEIGNSVTGNMGLQVGADGLLSANLLLDDGDPVTTIDGYSLQSGGEDLHWLNSSEGVWAAIPEGDGQAAFMVHLDNSSGEYTVTQTGLIDGVMQSGGTYDNSSLVVQSGDKSPELLILDSTFDAESANDSTTYSDGVFVLAEAFGRNISEEVYIKMSNQGLSIGYISNQGGAGQFLAGDYNDADVWESQTMSLKFLSETTVTDGDVQDGYNLLPVTSVTVTFDQLGYEEAVEATLWLDGQQVGDVEFVPSESLFNGNSGGGNADTDPAYTFSTTDTGGKAFDEITFGVANAPDINEESAEYRIASITVDSYMEDADHTISLPFEIVDNDNDTAEGEIKVTFDAVGNIDATEVYEDITDPGMPGMAISGSEESDVIIGTSGNDIIIGDDGADSIFGGDGDDLLYGGAGDNDQLIGGDGVDHLDGGTGNDILIGDEVLFGDTGDANVIVEDDDLDTLLGGDGDNDIAGDASFNDNVDDGIADSVDDPDVGTVEAYISQDELDSLVPPTDGIV